jgi:hypothetical protein
VSTSSETIHAPAQRTLPGPLAQPERRDQGAWLALAVLGAIAFYLALRAGRNTTFFGDEWDFIVNRRGISPGVFLKPHSEHPVVVPVAIYKLLLAVFGADSYTPYRAAVALMHVATGVIVYLYCRSRLGSWLALIPASLMLFLGSAWEDIVWPFQMTFIGSVLFGLAAFVSLDGGPRRDWLTCLMLLLSATSSALGLPFIIAVAVELAFDPRRWRRSWVVIVPAAVFAFIVVVLGNGNHAHAPPSHVARFVLNMAAAGFSAFGTGPGWGQALLVGGIGVLVLAARRRPGIDVRLTALICGVLAFWLTTAQGRADLVPPDTSRYLYVSAGFLLVIFATALRRPRPNAVTLLAVGGATLLSCVSGAGLLKEGASTRLGNTATLLPELSALQLARDRVAPDLRIDPGLAPDIVAAKYFHAIDADGSPAPPAAVYVHGAENSREAFDGALMRSLGVALAPAPGAQAGGAPPAVEAAQGGSATPSGACVAFRPNGANPALDVTAPPGTYLLTAQPGAAVPVFLRRLADAYTGAASLQLAGGTTAKLTIPRDSLAGPWHLRVLPQQAVKVCRGPA